MINLIKNEFTKIFSKKAIYIVFIVILAFMILIEVANNLISKVDEVFFQEDTNYMENLRNELNSIDKNNEYDREKYIATKSQIELFELKEKYGNNSWQWYILQREGYSFINGGIRYEFEPEIYIEEKSVYDEFIKKLESNDWKSFANEDLKRINEELVEVEKDENGNKITNYELEERKQVVLWRLEKDIPYGNNELNSALDTWLNAKSSLRDLAEQEKNRTLKHNEKLVKQSYEATIKINEYYITHDTTGMELQQDKIISNSDMKVAEASGQYILFIIVIIVMISGTIVAEEFNKGTIKLLLVKPYSRIKILFAKFITCILILALSLIVIEVLQFIIAGIFDGFNSFKGSAIIYNYTTGNLETIGIFKYMLTTIVSVLPVFMLLMTLAFFLSILFNNGIIGVALPLLGYMLSPIINTLAIQSEKLYFLKYFVTPNWDLTIYSFGKLQEFEPINFKFSIIVCAIYFVVMLVLSFIIFKKKDIKNV